MIWVVKEPGLLSIKEFSSLCDIKEYTLRYWDETQKLCPYKRTDGGKRYYHRNQIADAMILKQTMKNKRTSSTESKV